MRTIFILLFALSITIVKGQQSNNNLNSKAPCTIKITVAQLTNKDLYFKCKDSFKDNPFQIEGFRIKFEGSATINVKGKTLNGKAHSLARKLKAGDLVTIFDIKYIIVAGKKSQGFQSLVIQIIAP